MSVSRREAYENGDSRDHQILKWWICYMTPSSSVHDDQRLIRSEVKKTHGHNRIHLHGQDSYVLLRERFSRTVGITPDAYTL